MIGDEALNDEIRRLVESGWTLTAQTDATAGMSRDGLGIFHELQTDGTVKVSGTGKDSVNEEPDFFGKTATVSETVRREEAPITPEQEKYSPQTQTQTNHNQKVNLNEYVRTLVAEGWGLNSQTETTAAVTKPGERLNGCLVVLLLLCFLIPGLIYLFWPRHDLSVLVEVDNNQIFISGTGANQATDTVRALLRRDGFSS